MAVSILGFSSINLIEQEFFSAGSGEPCGGDFDPRVVPGVGEETQVHRHLDGWFLCTMVRPLPGPAARVEENGTGTKISLSTLDISTTVLSFLNFHFCVQMLSGIVNVGTVDCQRHHSLCQSENVRAYPEIRLFPQNSNRRDQYQCALLSHSKSYCLYLTHWFNNIFLSCIAYRSYNGWHRDAFSLKTWALR